MRRPERGARIGAAAAMLVAGLVSLILGLFATLPASAAGEGPDDEAATTSLATAAETPPEVPETSPEDPETPPEDPETPPEDPETPPETPSASPSSSPPVAPVKVTNAVLRWGVSNQTNARSHSGAFNFLAAGVANPGRRVPLLKSQWRAIDGNVRIEKRSAAGGWRTATWEGLGTSPAGDPIDDYSSFSEHTVALRKGTGTVDRAAGTASITWRGTFTVVYYGGFSIFTMTDPTLTVAGGFGTLTATLGGFLASRDDPRLWQEADPKRVRVADLPAVELGSLGFTVQPKYDGVAVTGSEPQMRTGADWGSFPQPFVSYLAPLGIDQFWYSTKVSASPTKRPLPLTVSYSAKEVAAPTPTATTSPKPEVHNSAPPAPTLAPTPPAALAPAMTAAPVAGVPAGATPPALAAMGALPPSVQLTAAPVAGRGPAPSASAGGAGWFVGGALLLAAALLLLLPAPGPGPRRTPS